MLLAKGLDELDVLLLLAVGGKDAQVSLTLVQSLGGLADTANETVSDQSGFQNSSQCFINVHLTNSWLLSCLIISAIEENGVLDKLLLRHYCRCRCCF